MKIGASSTICRVTSSTVARSPNDIIRKLAVHGCTRSVILERIHFVYLMYVSHIMHIEVVAALRRTGRREGLHHSFVDAMVNIFERHITASTAQQRSPIYHITPLLPGIESLAAHLCNKYWALDPYPLRSLDAIQLASAIFVAALVRGPLILVVADARLSAIAQLEGFQVINPAFPPSAT